MNELTEEEVREIKHRSVISKPTALDVSRLVISLTTAREDRTKFKHALEIHHNFYKCVPRAVADARLESVETGYRKLLILAFELIEQLKVKNSTLPGEIHAFEDYARSLWGEYDRRPVSQN